MKAMCGILLGALLALGQQPPVPAPTPEQKGVVFSVTSTLVQVDAVVTDAKGHNVSDLRPDDFQVLIDGKRQTLTHFSYLPLSIAAAPSVAPVQSAKSGPVLPPPPAAQLRPEDVRRTIVLTVDDLGLSFESMAFVRKSLRKFIENQTEPGDLVAIMRTGSGSGTLQQFTNDKRVLLAVIDNLRWNASGRMGISYFQPLGMYSNLVQLHGGYMHSSDPRSLDVRYELRNNLMSTVGTLSSISHTVDALREMPGRKSIVLLSDGIRLFSSPCAGPGIETYDEVRDAMRKLIDRANRAGTVIYTIQGTGLQTGQLDAADRAPGTPRDLHRLTQVGGCFSRDSILNADQQGLAYLAEQTGGLAYDNSNNLNLGLARMLEDQKGYYLLGFQPPEDLFLTKNGTPRFHGLAVKVEGSGLHVRSRTGFFGQTDDQVVSPKPLTPLEQMRAAVLSPFHSAGVGLRLTALYVETPKGGAVVRNLLNIDAHDLTWKSAPDGSASATLELIAVATGSGDTALDTVARQYVLTVASGKLLGAMRDGAVYTLDVPVRKRGAYQIRVAVRDDATAKVGSASQFLEIPELKKARFALASIILQDGGVGSANVDALKIAPARRQFRQGADMEYFCAVAKGGDRQSTTEVTTEIQIVREGREVYSASAKVVDVPAGPAVFGALRLSDKMAPGEYYLHVIATDPRGGKNAAADQWTDFEVMP